jgi:hypothetical protein
MKLLGSFYSYDLTAMETTTNHRINNIRRLQTAQAANLNRMKAQTHNSQFSSRRGSLNKNDINRRVQRRNKFRNASGIGGLNGQQVQSNKMQQAQSNQMQQALLKRQQLKRRHQLYSQLQNRQKVKPTNPRMKLGASTTYGNAELHQPSKRYTRRLNNRGGGDHPPSYDSPPNIMQNHYDREYSNTFNEPFPSPQKKPFDPPNIFTQGHPGETRYWEQSYDDDKTPKGGKKFKTNISFYIPILILKLILLNAS